MSVGEVELAGTLLSALRSLEPGLPVLVTASTPAGVALLHRRFQSDLSVTTRPFPLDLPFSVRRFVEAAAPGALVLLETELWPMVLRAAARRGIPVLIASGRLSARSAGRYRAARRLLAPSLAPIARVLARTAEDAARFAEIGIPGERIEVGGDLKYDRPVPPEPPFAAALRRLAAGRPVVVAGSIADDEIELVLDVHRRLAARGLDTLLVLAPRRPESFDAIARRLGARFRLVRRTQPGVGPGDVFLLDSLGELASTYRLGDVALLGGTFAPRGGHNVLEPLRAGLPTVHGPSTSNLAATLRQAAGATFAVADAAGAAERIGELLCDPVGRLLAREAAGRLFDRNQGAALRAAEAALGLLRSRP